MYVKARKDKNLITSNLLETITSYAIPQID